MKVTVTFTIPKKNADAAVKYWKKIGSSMTWKKYLTNSIGLIGAHIHNLKVTIDEK